MITTYYKVDALSLNIYTVAKNWVSETEQLEIPDKLEYTILAERSLLDSHSPKDFSILNKFSFVSELSWYLKLLPKSSAWFLITN